MLLQVMRQTLMTLMNPLVRMEITWLLLLLYEVGMGLEWVTHLNMLSHFHNDSNDEDDLHVIHNNIFKECTKLKKISRNSL
jgi:hypothetical protein